MKFIDKLIEETRAGDLDFVWQFYNNDRFKYKADKHPLSDLNFSINDIVTKEITKDNGKKKVVTDESKGIIVFPNGAGLEVDKSKLEFLDQECNKAIIRAMSILAEDYASGTIQKEIELQKKKKEAEKNKAKKAKEKQSNEEQGNQVEVSSDVSTNE
jgi:hypothetical protein